MVSALDSERTNGNDKAVRVRALAADIVMCSWARLYSHSAFDSKG